MLFLATRLSGRTLLVNWSLQYGAKISTAEGGLAYIDGRSISTVNRPHEEYFQKNLRFLQHYDELYMRSSQSALYVPPSVLVNPCT